MQFLSIAGMVEAVSFVFFDVDGTLIDSYPGIRASFVHAMTSLGYPLPPEDQIRTIPGPPMVQSLARFGVPEAQLGEGLAHYMSATEGGNWKKCEPYAGLPELLPRLAKDFTLATATSKSERFALKVLELFEMREPFSFIGAAQENGPRREKHDVIEYVLDKLELHGRESEILMVGDRQHDIAGAAQFGIPTVAVTWGYGTPEEWAAAQYRADTPAQLEEIIYEHFGNKH